MTEINRIARMFKQVFEGSPYHGRSTLPTLENVTAAMAAHQPAWSAHCIWERADHLTAELRYTLAVLHDSTGPREEGQTTRPARVDRSKNAWQHSLANLQEANRGLVHAIEQLDDAILDEKPTHTRGPAPDFPHRPDFPAGRKQTSLER